MPQCCDVPAIRRGTNIVLIVLWFWLFRGIYPYLGIIFSREEFRTNQVVLLAVLALIAFQVRDGHLRPRLDRLPQANRPALVLLLAGAILYLLCERFLDINTLSAALAALSGYGLLGLWLDPARWRQGLPAALLLIGALPFGEHLQTFVGYPMRLLTAALVRDGLAAGGVHSVGVDTILIFENGISQVDLPCSGVKSLWTGGLFLIAATWIERRPLNRRWLLVAMLLAGFLFLANLARVGVLVSVGEVLGLRLLAQMLHVPLGVLGFVAACIGALALLRALTPSPSPTLVGEERFGPHPQQTLREGEAVAPSPTQGLTRVGLPKVTFLSAQPDRKWWGIRFSQPSSGGSKTVSSPLGGARGDDKRVTSSAYATIIKSLLLKATPRGRVRVGASTPLKTQLRLPETYLTPLLGLAFLLLGLAYTPRSQTGLTGSPPAWTFPTAMVVDPLPLRPDELAWFTRDGAESAERIRFEWQGISGSTILVTSRTWRAHHRPERCFEVYGLSLNDGQTHLVDPDFPLRVVSLGDQQVETRYTAVYWFQSPTRTTADYGARMWADLTPRRERWVLVSILFDTPLDPRAAEVQGLYRAMHEAVAAHLAGDGSP